jgi:hypothetical protein
MYIYIVPYAHAKFRIPGHSDTLVKAFTPNAKRFSHDCHIVILHAINLYILFQGLLANIISEPKSNGASVAPALHLRASVMFLLTAGNEKLQL